MRHRKTQRKQSGAVTRVGAGKQASLFSSAAVRAITLTRRQQIEARLEQARQSGSPDSFWTLWFERERLQRQDAAVDRCGGPTGPEEANEGLQLPEGPKSRRNEGEA